MQIIVKLDKLFEILMKSTQTMKIVGGSGKQSLTKLASFAAGYEVFEITLSRGYGERELREELKTLYQKLGMENKPHVFLFGDQHVAEEGTRFHFLT